MPQSYFRVRLALVVIFAVFAFGFLVPPGQAQPGRPPGFPSPPRPPTFPAIPAPPRPPTFPAMPGGATGIHGISGAGISGAGISGITGTPGGITGIPSPPSFGAPSRNEWVCSGCRRVVGTGPIRPNVTTCPGCGARFSNPGFGAPSGGAPGGAAPGGAPAGGAAGAASEPSLLAPELPPNPATGAGGAPGTSPAPFEPAPVATPSEPAPFGIESAAPNNEPEKKKGSRTILIVGVVGGGLFLIGAMAMLAMVVVKANAPQKARRPKRRTIEYDD